MASDKIEAVDSSTFDAKVVQSDQPVLVDFWATWCGPCRQIAPTLEELADELDGQVKITKLDVDGSQDVAIKYGVQGIPTLILFKDGEVADRLTGAHPKAVISELITRNA